MIVQSLILMLSINKTSTTQTTINGYSYFVMNYDVVVSMVDNISVRYINDHITYNLSFYSKLLVNNEVDTSISTTVPITFEPQKVKRIDLFHYTNGEVSLSSDNGDSSTYQYNPSESASTTLIPGISGLLKLIFILIIQMFNILML
jgi:hypothetical protein